MLFANVHVILELLSTQTLTLLVKVEGVIDPATEVTHFGFELTSSFFQVIYMANVWPLNSDEVSKAYDKYLPKTHSYEVYIEGVRPW